MTAPTAPDLEWEPDRHCRGAASHNWEHFRHSDTTWGIGFRCSHCRLIRWAWRRRELVR